MKKELWLNIQNMDFYLQKEQSVLDILNTYVGDASVVLFDADSRGIKRLRGSLLVSTDNDIINELEEILGTGTVKCVEKSEDINESYNLYDELTNEFTAVPGYTDKMRLKFMELERLDRIADELGCIRQAIQVLEPLADCVDEAVGYGSRFCTTGTMTTYER